jgi:hypothetical protein
MSLHRPCLSIMKFNPVPLRRRDRYRPNPPLWAAKLDAIGLQFRNQVDALMGEDHRLLDVIATPLLSISASASSKASSTTKSAAWQSRARRCAAQDNLYELTGDRMLLNSKNRPKVDGLPVPFVELSAGKCTQLVNFAAGQVSSVACAATDRNGRKYELQFESDGSPITIRRVKPSPPTIRERS